MLSARMRGISHTNKRIERIAFMLNGALEGPAHTGDASPHLLYQLVESPTGLPCAPYGDLTVLLRTLIRLSPLLGDGNSKGR
jgi:hypothetical protein